MWIIWLSLFAAMVVIEASGPALISIWFAAGALISLIASFIPGVAWWVQVIVFVVISIAAVFCLRPLIKRYMSNNEVIKTNIDSFVGKSGYVIEDITYVKPGAVKINGVSWTAVPINKKETILEKCVIEVVAIDGNKLVVKKVEEK